MNTAKSCSTSRNIKPLKFIKTELVVDLDFRHESLVGERKTRIIDHRNEVGMCHTKKRYYATLKLNKNLSRKIFAKFNGIKK
jgi:hypothetical protein